ncbi:hypothetical protein [Campylobacter devanensis]|uniref:hypothetical protein n=1 Tax=Campylobacter devanensis TaxID=3161138 RepID=UPI000A34BACF|nr:hypothetical protein [Campylobacter sp. P0023]
MALSSINFQKSSGHSYKHNFREDEPSYLLKEKDREPNEYWQHEKTAEQIFTDEVAKIEKGKKGKRPKFENSHWEGVLNLNSNHTMDEVKKVAEHIEKKFNITCTAIAIHRDEGHYTDNGYAVKNYHAHLNFCTYKDKKQQWRLENIKPQDLRELQTEISEILKMERGIDKRESKRQRLEHREYKQKERELKAIKQELEAKDNVIQAKNQVIQDKDQELEDEKLSKKRLKEQIKQEAQERENKIKEILYDRIDKLEADIKEKDKVIQAKNQELEQEKLSKAELKKELEKLRQNSKNQGFSKEFFQEINLEKKKLRFDNKKELEVWFQNLVEKHTKKGIFSNQVDNEAIFEEMYKVYKEPYEKIEDLEAKLKYSKAENTELKNEKERFHELLESDPALKEAYNQALKNLENRKKEKMPDKKRQWLESKERQERILDKRSEQDQENDHDDYEEETQENTQKTPNNLAEQEEISLGNIVKDDKPLFPINSDKTKASEQTQEHSKAKIIKHR